MRAIVQRDFAGSQTDFSQHCGLDPADTSRVVAGVRPATLGFVRRATEMLGEKAAAELIAAFLTDVAGGVTNTYSVALVIRAKPGATTDPRRTARKWNAIGLKRE